MEITDLQRYDMIAEKGRKGVIFCKEIPCASGKYLRADDVMRHGFRPDRPETVATEGDDGNLLQVTISRVNGDAVITILNTDERESTVRIRTFHGGGHKLRVLEALKVLANAIHDDNENPTP